MEFHATQVEGAMVVRPEARSDARGWFARVFCVEEFAQQGLETVISQINLAETTKAGTIRGLHYQLPPAPDTKLVRCVSGAIYNVVVDVRRGSATFGNWVGVELTAAEGHALYVPSGCAHGYQALTRDARALYQASAPYTTGVERGVHHADPAIGVVWPLPPVNVSDKDLSLPPLAEADLGGD